MYTNVEAVSVLIFSAIFVNYYTKFPLYWILVKKKKKGFYFNYIMFHFLEKLQITFFSYFSFLFFWS
jgi:hypothetical protein